MTQKIPESDQPTSNERRRRLPAKTKYVIEAGAHAPVAQLRLLNPAQWEQFVEECCLPLEGKSYAKVKRLGMPGDKGRDVEAIVSLPRVKHGWDLYQCKYYKDPVSPSSFFPEMASFFVHLAGKSYPEPRAYYICAPMDCGVDLHDLLVEDPAVFKAVFLDAWQQCKRGLKSKPTGDVKAAVEAFDFARFQEMPARTLVEMHAANKAAHHKRFGIKPKRDEDDEAPSSPTAEEDRYIEELLAVYSEHAACPIGRGALPGSDYEAHFSGSRSEFYSAAGLERFSRDVFPGEFDTFLSMMLKTVKTSVSHPKHKSGFERLDAAANRAHQFRMPESPLSESFRQPDMPGACHHLVNVGKLKWMK